MQSKKVYIGQMLLDKKIITQEQLDAAIEHQKATGLRLGQALIDLHLVKEDQLLKLLSEQLNVPFINLREYTLIPEVVNILPEFHARHFRALVLKKDKDGYLVGMVDPQDILAKDEISQLLKSPIHIALVKEDDLMQSIDLVYRRTAEISTFAEELSLELGKAQELNVTQLGENVSVADAPVIKMLKSIFEDAVQMGASDIHIEPDEHVLRIRQRIDGVLYEQIIKEKKIIQALTLRLKLIAGINITEKRIPQDGRFTIKVKDKTFDVRLSTLPVQFGESVVMRLLGQSAVKLNLTKIGMPDTILIRMRRIIAMPNGLLIITGPTGSGKTTTLYGALAELNDSTVKIITVEDPVEYRLPRINQVQIQSSIDLTFARALRAILRQDPDIIMIGELRDGETVSIALRAALTGHLVLSTLHTNDAISSVMRLLDMGAESYLVAAVLRGILAQRLVRRICEECIQDTELTPQEKVWISAVAGPSYAQLTYKNGKGCNYCHNSGYRGQIGVFELLELNEKLIDALRDRNMTEFSHLAKQQETYRPLALSGLDMAVKGITTVSEVLRISGDTFFNEEKKETDTSSQAAK
ncbi:MAG: ATPase, T2SS/T4P/T4SS family [Gammaproteobacteria bacterium]|nr:ATPase, T2SS/T4P/T4SS family [Gammaproteobacteria bacterium]